MGKKSPYLVEKPDFVNEIDSNKTFFKKNFQVNEIASHVSIL